MMIMSLLSGKLHQVFNLKIEAENGFSIFGRKSGAYPAEISFK
jgi:hypothetical protein